MAYLSGLHHSKQKLNIMENILENLLLTDSEVRIVIVGVGADVDDAVHVEVEVVKLWDLVLLHHLAEAGVPFTKPPVELGDTHPGLKKRASLVQNFINRF